VTLDPRGNGALVSQRNGAVSAPEAEKPSGCRWSYALAVQRLSLAVPGLARWRSIRLLNAPVVESGHRPLAGQVAGHEDLAEVIRHKSQVLGPGRGVDRDAGIRRSLGSLDLLGRLAWQDDDRTVACG